MSNKIFESLSNARKKHLAAGCEVVMHVSISTLLYLFLLSLGIMGVAVAFQSMSLRTAIACLFAHMIVALAIALGASATRRALLKDVDRGDT